MRIVYITANSLKEAKNISFHLLEKRLVACTNIIPILSMYWWEEQIQEGEEYVILAKTKEKNFELIEKEIIDLHSNKTPAIYSWKVDKVNKKYKDWIEKETK